MADDLTPGEQLFLQFTQDITPESWDKFISTLGVSKDELEDAIIYLFDSGVSSFDGIHQEEGLPKEIGSKDMLMMLLAAFGFGVWCRDQQSG